MRFGRTVADARQFISHGHIKVNGKKMNIPSYLVQDGDIITVRDKKSSKERATNTIATVGDYDVPEWLVVEDDKLTGKVVRMPIREDVRCPVDEQKVIEFYSK
jgi:small subunit ribosomal protein S4